MITCEGVPRAFGKRISSARKLWLFVFEAEGVMIAQQVMYHSNQSIAQLKQVACWGAIKFMYGFLNSGYSSLLIQLKNCCLISPFQML